jgi:hypothetical protein
MIDVQIIDGPAVPETAGEPLFQVTLASGAIATRPTSFAVCRPEQTPRPIIVAENGEALDVSGPVR